MRYLSCLASAGLFFAVTANGIELDLNSPESIKAASKTIARGMLSYTRPDLPPYIPGLINDQENYYWWEAGAIMGAMVDYYYYTDDTTFNANVTEALLFQVGANKDYMPANQTSTEGNDDQGFWALAAMSAAEVNFPNPPVDQPQWLALAQAVFNLQAARWDTTQCGGGLKWQIFPFNAGYNYKNSISQGCFFNLAARLALYTGNQTYADWANKMWDWCAAVKLVDTSSSYEVYDGSDSLINCTELNHIRWSYNTGVFLYGAAVMYNYTNGTQRETWRDRTQGLMRGGDIFFKNQIMTEQACEGGDNCNFDQRSFKAYLSRWMAASTKVAPFLIDTVMPLLRSSAQAAAKTCTGGADGTACGLRWTTGAFDGSTGPGEQLAALEVIQSNLINAVDGPLGNATGATSIGDPSAGGERSLQLVQYPPITTADRAGAGILTAVVLLGTISTGWWLLY